MTARRRRVEDQVQRTIVQHYRQRAMPGVFMFAVPNGGWRSPVEAAIMRGTGTVAGVPDTIWIKNGRAFALELKSEHGRLSESQRNTHEAMRAAGAIVGVVVGLGPALQWLEGHGLLRGRAT